MQERLGQRGDVIEVRKRHLGLNHPELRRVPPRVGVLGAESRAEGVNIAHRASVGLAFKLTAHGQRGVLSEEILFVIDRAVLTSRQCVKIKRRNLKHRPRPRSHSP